ncbi:unnamed protein product [Triticum turgidum subsp. durum]|uniref:Phospholipase/carboxylesterase/thioesterase domain-containing protein n=1 Tax=Triticum turgidum subsp. durum TaxID=4567 RepID=A0A9R1Q1V4_TRITD|nr:unnamed protein product [Triticum turgidum subsp. durum]
MAAPPPAPAAAAAARAGGLVLWLHGSAETGEHSRGQIAPYFSAAPAVRLSFPTAPIACVGTRTDPTLAAPDSTGKQTHLRFYSVARSICGVAAAGDVVLNAWFGIPEVPITATTVRDEEGVLEAVEHVHKMLDKEVAAGTCPTDIFVCGLSQGGALAIASVLLYPKTLGGCVVFSGSVPLSKSFAVRVPPEARKTPVLWFHGMADGVVLFEAGHAGCAFLQELGMACEFKTYPTLGHSLVDEELQYFRRWIFDRLGVSQGTEDARPSSSSSNHEDLH